MYCTVACQNNIHLIIAMNTKNRILSIDLKGKKWFHVFNPKYSTKHTLNTRKILCTRHLNNLQEDLNNCYNILFQNHYRFEVGIFSWNPLCIPAFLNLVSKLKIWYPNSQNRTCFQCIILFTVVVMNSKVRYM